MRPRNNNPRKLSFLDGFRDITLSSGDIKTRCRFNFSYFDDTQEFGAGLGDMSADELRTLFEKLKCYSTSSLNFWRGERCGGSRSLRVLADYGSFPDRSKFHHPKFVPIDVRWGRFRMENLSRLIGFTVPASLCGNAEKDGADFDLNTFYVVFIDREHKFYLTETK